MIKCLPLLIQTLYLVPELAVASDGLTESLLSLLQPILQHLQRRLINII